MAVEELVTVMQAIQRDVNCLSDECRNTRKRSLNKLVNVLGPSQCSDHTLASIFSEIQKPLLKIFSDPVEKCREIAIQFSIDSLARIPNIDEFLPYLIPIITSRLSSEEIVEPSEEIRLDLVKLLKTVVQKEPVSLELYVEDFLVILTKTLMDSFPDLKKESCELFISFVPLVHKRFHSQSSILGKPLQLCAGHQHSKVRHVALKAIYVYIQYGDVTNLDELLPTLGQLLFDQSGMVRKALTDCVGDWLLNLLDRYSYHHKLLPVLLSLYSDDSEEISVLAHQYYSKIGALYEKENEEELKQQIDLSFPETNPNRPSLGCRILAARNLSKILPALLKELSDWTVFRRKKAASLLYELILHCEEYFTQHLETTLSAMYRALQDEDPSVVATTLQCANLLGHFITPDAYLSVMYPHLRSYTGGAPLHVSSCLHTLAKIIEGTHPRDLFQPHLEPLLGALSERDFVESEHTELQRALLFCTHSLINQCQDLLKPFTYQIFVILLHLQSLSSPVPILLGDSPSILLPDFAQSSLDQLFVFCFKDDEMHKGGSLYDVYFEKIIENFESNADLWTKSSSEIQMFQKLLLHTTQFSTASVGKIYEIFNRVCHPEKDPEMRLQFLTLLCRVFSAHSNIFCQDLTILRLIVMNIILPNLVWKAGRTSGAARTASMSALWSIFHFHESAKQIFCDLSLVESIFPHLKSTLDDDNTTTRLITCKVFHELFSIYAPHRSCPQKKLSQDLLHGASEDFLKRLDDNRDEIRFAIANMFSVYVECFSEPYDQSLYSAHLEFMLKGLLIHLDDSEQSIQEGVFSVLEKCVRLDSLLLLQLINQIRHKHRSPLFCDQLVNLCQKKILMDQQKNPPHE